MVVVIGVIDISSLSTLSLTEANDRLASVLQDSEIAAIVDQLGTSEPPSIIGFLISRHADKSRLHDSISAMRVASKELGLWLQFELVEAPPLDITPTLASSNFPRFQLWPCLKEVTCYGFRYEAAPQVVFYEQGAVYTIDQLELYEPSDLVPYSRTSKYF